MDAPQHQDTRRADRADRYASLAVFCVVATVYLASPVKVQSDSRWSVPTAISLLREGDLDLDEYEPTWRANPYATFSAQGHRYGIYPVLTSVVIAPPLGVFHALVVATQPVADVNPRAAAIWRRWRDHFHQEGNIDVAFFATTEHIFASLLVAIAAALFFLAARSRLPVARAVIATLAFALATSAYSTASRLLWQHGVSLLFSAALLRVLSTERLNRASAVAAGLLTGLTFVARPTNVTVVIAITVFVGWRHRDQVAAFLMGGMLVAVAFVTQAWVSYGGVLPPYFSPGRPWNLPGEIPTALLANLVSPGRGLLVYSPVLLVGLAAIIRRRPREPLAVVSAAIVIAHWVVISTFERAWWGGHSYGPRLFTDAMAWAAWLLVAPLGASAPRPGEQETGRGKAAVRSARPGDRKSAYPTSWWRPVFVLLLVVSTAMHARGATVAATHWWNGWPQNVDEAPQRVWDWSDPPFLRTANPPRR